MEHGPGRQGSQRPVILGEFGTGKANPTLTVDGLTPGRDYTLDFEVLAIRSWDGDDGVWGTDQWTLNVDGREVLRAQFNNMHDGARAHYQSDAR